MSSKRKTTMCQEGLMIPGDTVCYPKGSKQAIAIGDRGATCQMAAEKDCIKRDVYINHIKGVLGQKSQSLEEKVTELMQIFEEKTANKLQKLNLLKNPQHEQFSENE